MAIRRFLFICRPPGCAPHPDTPGRSRDHGLHLLHAESADAVQMLPRQPFRADDLENAGHADAEDDHLPHDGQGPEA
jgi:hypothetical protein